MSLRRRCLRLRTRKTLALMVVGVILLGVVLTYRTLTDHDMLHPPSSSVLPRKPFHFRPRDGFDVRADREIVEIINNEVRMKRKLSREDIREVLNLLYPPSWKTAIEPDEVAIMLKDHMINLELHSPVSCKEIDNLQIGASVASSPRKFVEMLRAAEGDDHILNGADGTLVLKSQNNDLATKIACMKQIYNAEFCNSMGNYLLMREVFFLSFLQHPSLIRVKGFCLRGDGISLDMRKKGLMLVMEFGVPLSPDVVSSMSWAVKVRLALDASRLLAFLDSSPLGSLGLPYVQMKDFVVVNGKSLKLVDLDDILLEEKQCESNSDCRLNGFETGVECQDKRCRGLNHKQNQQVFYSAVFKPLLSKPPPKERTQVESLLSQVQHMTVYVNELISFLENQTAKFTDVEDSVGYKALKRKRDKFLRRQDDLDDNDEDEEERDNVIDRQRDRQDDRENMIGEGVDDAEDHEQQVDEQEPAANPQPHRFQRMESSNFPGMYDYTCKESRVLWGCVMTMKKLSAAMDHCWDDPECHAFAVFSSHPETEDRMTVVFKGRHNGSPHVNLGVTLFIKKLEEDRPQISDDAAVDTKQNETKENDKVEANPETEMKEKKESEVEKCVTRTQENQQSALHSREKRLMAHMGYKAMTEDDWKRAVRSETITSFSSVRFSGSSLRGGSMLVLYNTGAPGHRVTKAKFLVEQSTEESHIAFALVYHIDRLLGLYHTPPAVGGYLSADAVQNFSRNDLWKQTFSTLTDNDGKVRGLFVIPTPKVLKSADLILQPLTEMVEAVAPFGRTEKMQLEYILLWWIAHIQKTPGVYQGFKNHLIHLDADKGFQETSVTVDNLRTYLNYCQFPNVVYKMLSCFRCSSSSTKICSLGQEAVRRLEEEDGFQLADLHIPGMKEKKQYLKKINGAASKIVEAVQSCIDKFGHEMVLY